MRSLTVSGDARYRTIEEARIVDLLLLHGWAFEVRDGARSAAEPQAQQVVDRLVAMGLPCEESRSGERLFDPVEALNFLRWAYLYRNDRTLVDKCVPTARHLVLEAHHPNSNSISRPPAPTSLGPRRYAVLIQRTFNLESRQPGERVRLRLPLPLEGESLRDLEITFLPPEGIAFETIAAPARLDVLISVPRERQATIGIKVSFTARPFSAAPPGVSLDSAEAELYKRPGEGLIRISERIRALAEDLAGAETDSWAVIRRLWNFLLDELACGAVHYDQLDPAHPIDRVLEHGWYDCQLGSALFVALCRARGIPARLVNGYMLHAAAPAFHTWLEIWIEGHGWAPFDLFSWDLSAGGRDADWRDYYFGRLDHRMPVERPPLLFNGTGALRLPAAWHRVVAPVGPGSVVEFRALETGALVYREYIEIKRLDDAAN